MQIYEFNHAPGKPLVNLAYANGFLPQTYAWALQPLFDAYRVISVQARPMWENCPPDSLTSWYQLGDDLLKTLDSLTDQPVIGIGHSFGGVYTAWAAIQRPEKFSRLVLIDPTWLPRPILWLFGFMRLLRRDDRLPLVQGALRRRRRWDSADAAYASFRGKPLFARFPDPVLRVYVESITTPDPDGSVRLSYTPEWEARIYQTMPTDLWKLPGQITQPTLVLRGEFTDTFTEASARTFHRLNPSIGIETIHGAGHLVPQEQPEQVGRLIMQFLST